MARNRRRGNERGFAMLFVFLMAAVIAITLYMELPRVAMQAQRDKEQRLIDTGEQYKRAIQLFVAKAKRYPGDIKELESFQNQRFLRRRYKDPMTGKDEWRLIHVGPGRRSSPTRRSQSPPAPEPISPPVRTASSANRPVSRRRTPYRAPARPTSATAAGPATAPTGPCRGLRFLANLAATWRTDKITESRLSPGRLRTTGRIRTSFPVHRPSTDNLCRGCRANRLFPCHPERRCKDSRACPERRCKASRACR